VNQVIQFGSDLNHPQISQFEIIISSTAAFPSLAFFSFISLSKHASTKQLQKAQSTVNTQPSKTKNHLCEPASTKQ
jgi:hypothetical protein